MGRAIIVMTMILVEFGSLKIITAFLGEEEVCRKAFLGEEEVCRKAFLGEEEVCRKAFLGEEEVCRKADWSVTKRLIA